MSKASIGFALFVLLSVVWTLIWAFVLVRSGPPTLTYAAVAKRAAAIRVWLFWTFGSVLFVLFVLSVYFFPYRAFAMRRMGRPQLKVEVVGKMWTWEIHPDSIPAHTMVEFDVTAGNINHGFGIYSPAGRLINQVQAMPGYTNQLVTSFDQPGKYTVRCLEYCSLGHHLMVSSFEVTPKKGGK